MPEQRIYPYEAMFLFPQAVVSDLKSAVSHITDILERHNAEIISLKKWDERRLAYDLRGNKRGVFFLVYFRAPAPELQKIERDCNLSEKMLRALIVRADHVSPELMQAAEGREQIEDEIKLRASGAAPVPTSDDEAAEPEESEAALALDED